MIRHPPLRPAALAALVAAGVSMPAAAGDFALGTVSAPSTVFLNSADLFGTFTDTFSFTVAAGQAVDFSSYFDTGFWIVLYINDFAASLWKGSQLVAQGVTIPFSFPQDYGATFSRTTLTAGDYSLVITGDEHAVYPGSDSGLALSGSILFAPVPEPGSPVALVAGLALLGAAAALSRRGR